MKVTITVSKTIDVDTKYDTEIVESIQELLLRAGTPSGPVDNDDLVMALCDLIDEDGIDSLTGDFEISGSDCQFVVVSNDITLPEREELEDDEEDEEEEEDEDEKEKK